MNPKYIAHSLDLIHWYASVWIDYCNSYVDIKSSPCFKNPDAAIAWAKQVGF